MANRTVHEISSDLKHPVTNMLNKLHGQPESYDKKSVKPKPSPLRLSRADMSRKRQSRSAPLTPLRSPPLPLTQARSQYAFGKTLGAGTYGIVREATCPAGKVAVKIILKKNVKGNEQMVYDELELLQSLNHPHIVRFHDWFEPRVRYGGCLCESPGSDGSRTSTTLSPN